LVESVLHGTFVHAGRSLIGAVAIIATAISLPCPSGASEEPNVRPVHRGTDAALGVYRQHCVNCHGKDGSGSRVREVMPQIPDFTNARWQKNHTDVQLALSIREGKGKLMPAFDDRLSPKQAKDLVLLVRSFNQSGMRKSRESATEFETQLANLQKSLKELRAQFQELSGPPPQSGPPQLRDAAGPVKQASNELPPTPILNTQKERGEAPEGRPVGNRPATLPAKASLVPELMSVWPSPIHAYLLPTLWPLLLWALWQTSRQPSLFAQARDARSWPGASGWPVEEPRDAAQLFRRHCSRCHGGDGAGRRLPDHPMNVPDFTDPGWQARRSDSDLRTSILDGQGAKMPPFRGKIGEDQANALVPLVRAFGSDGAQRWAEREDSDPSEAALPSPAFLEKLIRWLGNFHPPAVSFPVALLVAAALAELLRAMTGHALFDGAARFCLWLGALTAIIAVALGWCRGGFQSSDASWVLTTHRWLGTATALWSQLVLALSEGSRRSGHRGIQEVFRLTLFVGAGLVLSTGFLGGALVYGLQHYLWR
jgi:mono/diheme cytochrome c family protein/uncharacterized membrane protein